MRVAVYYNNHDLRIEERPLPQIGPGEMLVKIMASGICGSDVLEWYRLKKAPIVLGHEIAGIIELLGHEIKGFKSGDHIFVSHHVPCNTCYFCLNNHHTACDTLHNTNFDPGGFAEYIRVPEINVDRGVFLLPDNMNFEEGAFVEPLACVVRGQRIAALYPGQTVLILGCGISGMLHMLLARASGAGQVIVSDINEYRLAMAKRFGAHHVLNSQTDIAASVRAVNYGRGADLVIVCTGASLAFYQALKSVGRGGTILFFATMEPNVTLPLPINEFWKNEIKLTHSYGNAPQDALTAIELIRNQIIPVKEMITHRLSLEETGRGFSLVAEGGNSMKIMIYPHGISA